MKHLRLNAQLTDAEVHATCRARLCTPDDYAVHLVGDEDTVVYKPNGELLVMVLRANIALELRAAVLPGLQALKGYKTDNRGVYTAAGGRATLTLSNGELSKNTRTRKADGKILQVASAIIGYFDRMGGRHPFCRATRFTATEVAKWESLQPLIQHVDAAFKRELPARYRAQRNFVQQIRPDWRIGSTVFTTMTVNNNAVAGTHLDKGDYKKGFGIITCHRQGDYTGGELCFPQYRVGVDLRDGDVLFFNSHDWHGMVPIVGEGYERITCVYYARTKMLECGTPEQELARGRLVRGAL